MDAVGIHSHPLYKLGKGAAKLSPGTLRFERLFKAPVNVPAQYDFDTAHNVTTPTPMFGNDQYGCCVEAETAHQLLRFEWLEQQRVIPITTEQVVNQYFQETAGADSGLVMEDHLKLWKTTGVNLGGRVYKIRDFAAVPLKDRAQLSQAIYLDVGVGAGLQLPQSAMDQFEAGQPWSTVRSRRGRRIVGGHDTFLVGFNKTGPVCITWAKKQQMTWDFYNTYYDEVWAKFDAPDTAKTRRFLYTNLLQAA